MSNESVKDNFLELNVNENIDMKRYLLKVHQKFVKEHLNKLFLLILYSH